VDRIWPRGLSESAAQIDEWAHNIAPTTTLRKWYNHQPEHWKEFVKLYRHELSKNKEVENFINDHKNSKLLTLLFATKDPELSHASILKKYLEDHFPD